MKVFILGVGDAFTVKNYNTSFIVQSGDYNVGVECPHPYLRILNDVKAKNIPEIKELNDFVITHLHSDHCGGLQTLGYYKRFVENRKVNLFMSYGDHLDFIEMTKIPIEVGIINGKEITLHPTDFFNFRVMDIFSPKEQKICFNFTDPFTIKRVSTDHSIRSSAIIISDGNKKIGFSGDTKFNINLIDWLNDADVILHEIGHPYTHTDINELLKLPQSIKDKIFLIHYKDDFFTNDFKMAQQGQIIEI